MAALAAAYAYGLARNHPFVDGNKRTSFVTCELFLVMNGLSLALDDAAAAATWQMLAAGRVTEVELAHQIRKALRTE